MIAYRLDVVEGGAFTICRCCSRRSTEPQHYPGSPRASHHPRKPSIIQHSLKARLVPAPVLAALEVPEKVESFFSDRWHMQSDS